MRTAYVYIIWQILECWGCRHGGCGVGGCDVGARALPDMCALALRLWCALGHCACISGNALVPILQLLNVTLCVGGSKAYAGQYIGF